jgi:hypothetical protein
MEAASLIFSQPVKERKIAAMSNNLVFMIIGFKGFTINEN